MNTKKLSSTKSKGAGQCSARSRAKPKVRNDSSRPRPVRSHADQGQDGHVAQQIADLEAANARYAQTVKLLRSSEEVLAMGFEAASVGLAIVGLDGKAIRVNRHLCNLLEQTIGDLLGKQLFDIIYADDKSVGQALLSQILHGQLQDCMHDSLLVRVRAKPIWIRSKCVSMFNRQGKAKYLLITCEDITPQKQAEEAVRRSERLASVGTLASGIAHEINNPIGAALLAAEAALILKDFPSKREQLEKSLDTVIKSAERCADIIRRVQIFSQGSSSQKQRTSLNSVVDHARELTVSLATAKQVALHVHCEPELPELMLSSTEMQLALINLINNAIQASDPGNQVFVHAKTAKDTVRIAVKDQGRGMTKAERLYLFDPFYSTRYQEGAVGLGLSTTLGIVQQHGGRIEVQSRLGHGTTMTVVLPKEPPAIAG